MLSIRRNFAGVSGGFARSVAVLAGGTVLAQVLNVAVSPILSRMFSPDDFGVLAVYTSVLSVLGVIVAARYEQAIPLPDDDDEAAMLLFLSCVVSGLFSLVLALVVWFYPSLLTLWMRNDAAERYLWLIPITTLGMGIYLSFSYWATRKGEFRLVARTRLVQQLVGQVIVTIPFGLFRMGSAALLLGNSVTQVSGAGELVRAAWGDLRGRLQSPWTRLWSVAVRYREFPLYNVWASLISTVGLQIPVLFLSHFFSVGAVGHYAMALRLLGLPSALIGRAVAQVFYPKAAQVKDSGELGSASERLALALFALSFPVFGVVVAIGPQLFSAFFGPSWSIAGTYARLLAPWFMVMLVSSPLSTISLVKNKQRLALWLTIYEMGLRILALWVGGALLHSVNWSLALLSFAGVVISTVSIFIMTSLAGCNPWAIFRANIPVFALSCALFAVLWWVSRLVPAVAAIAISIPLCLVILLLLRKQLKGLLTI